MECTAGRLHHNARHSHIELVDVGGGLSRVIVTTLGRTWMPLLRYDIGDLVRVADGCTCGRADEGYVLARIEGRGNDAIATARGLVTPAMLDDTVDAAEPAIAHWQLQAPPTAMAAGSCTSSAATAPKPRPRSPTSSVRPVEPRSTTTILPEPSGKYRMVRPQG